MSTRRANAVCLLLACVLLLFAAPAGARSELLKHGSRGADVVQLQRALKLPADGVFGPQTTRAVRRFQAHHGLAVDGVVGPWTAAALGLGDGGTAGAAASARHDARPVAVPAVLAKIAACESGGDPHAVSANGAYRGKYQFTRSTWHAMGGSGDPAHASETEQDRRALALLHARGVAPWPACS